MNFISILRAQNFSRPRWQLFFLGLWTMKGSRLRINRLQLEPIFAYRLLFALRVRWTEV